MQPTMIQHIEIRTNRRGLERPYIVGTRVRLQDIVLDHERHGLSVDAIAREFPHITLAQIYAALAYYFDNREAVWQCIQDDAAYVEEMRQLAKHHDQDRGEFTNADSIPS